MTTLTLTLKKRWFDMILSGEKKEEYRELKPYCIQRFTWHEYHKNSIDKIITCHNMGKDVLKRNIDFVKFRNGYSENSPTFTIQLKRITLGWGITEWGADGRLCFMLELGDIVPTEPKLCVWCKKAPQGKYFQLCKDCYEERHY